MLEDVEARVGKRQLARFGGSLLLVNADHSIACVRDLGAVLAARGAAGMPAFVDEFPCSCGGVWAAAPMRLKW